MRAWFMPVLAVALLACEAEAPVSGVWPQEQPIITSAVFSRTGLSVRSIDESLKLYEGILGLAPFYERLNLKDERLYDYSGMKPGETMRLVVLRIETDGPAQINSGYLGLSELRNADDTLVELPAEVPKGRQAGAASLMFMVEDVLETYEKVKAGGYEIISHPKQRDDGSWTQLLMRGPDGERLWITQSENRTPFLKKIKRVD